MGRKCIRKRVPPEFVAAISGERIASLLLLLVVYSQPVVIMKTCIGVELLSPRSCIEEVMHRERERERERERGREAQRKHTNSTYVDVLPL